MQSDTLVYFAFAPFYREAAKLLSSYRLRTSIAPKVL